MSATICDTLSLSFPIDYLRSFFCSNPARYWASFGRPDLHNDQLRCSAHDLVSGQFADWGGLSESLPADFWAELLTDWLHDVTGVPFRVQVLGGGRNNFQNSARFDGGFIAWGGNNVIRQADGLMHQTAERVQIYFDATGCERLRSALVHIADRLDLHAGRVTRLDVAFDLMYGQISIDDGEKAYHLGKFIGNGRPPKALRIKELSDTGCGETLYIGNRKNGKMLRMYEKGKQLGDSSSPWVRAEVELGRKDREIPSDALRDLDRVFSESYPYLAEIIQEFAGFTSESEDSLIKTARKKAEISLLHLVRHAQVAYGKLVTVLSDLGHAPDKIVSMLAVEGLPARLSTASLGLSQNPLLEPA